LKEFFIPELKGNSHLIQLDGVSHHGFKERLSSLKEFLIPDLKGDSHLIQLEGDGAPDPGEHAEGGQRSLLTRRHCNRPNGSHTSENI
jgi:hypothetical protein